MNDLCCINCSEKELISNIGVGKYRCNSCGIEFEESVVLTGSNGR